MDAIKKRGVLLVVEVQAAGTVRLFAALLKKLGSLMGPNAEIGEYLVASTRRRFDTQSGPTGRAWAPLSAPYLKRKAAQGYSSKIGQRSGDFKNKLLHSETETTIAIGANVRAPGGFPYPIVFHKGNRSGTQPARPVFGLSKADNTAIRAILKSYLEAA